MENQYNSSRSIGSLEESASPLSKPIRKTPFLGTNLGCLTLMGIVGASTVGGASIAGYYGSSNSTIAGVAIITLAASGSLCDIVLNRAVGSKQKESYVYDKEFFKQVFYIPQMSRGLRNLGRYLTFRRSAPSEITSLTQDYIESPVEPLELPTEQPTKPIESTETTPNPSQLAKPPRPKGKNLLEYD